MLSGSCLVRSRTFDVPHVSLTKPSLPFAFMPPGVRCFRWLVGVAVLVLAGCASAPPDDTAFRSLTRMLESQPIVLLGEVHDNVVQHALRARSLRALVESGARPALLMEQFDRERQVDLDRAMAQPGAMADDVIAAAAPADALTQGWPWLLYKPYIALALEYRLLLVAANVSRDDSRRIAADGLAAHGFEARVPDDLAAGQARAIVEGHCGLVDAGQAGTLVAAQVARDQFMARAVEAHAARGALLLAGNGHVRTDLGVPRWIAPATRARTVSIGLLEAGRVPEALSPYDSVVVTPAQPRRDPCEGLTIPGVSG